MKNKNLLFAPLIAVLLLSSCKPMKSLMFETGYGTYYDYKFELVKPISSNNLKFTDDKVDFDFTILPTSIGFVLKNKTDETMKVIWDEVSIVLSGKAEKVFHGGVKYADRANSQPTSTIPAGASLDDVAVPINNVYYSEGFYSQYGSVSGSWKEKGLFPKNDENNEKLKARILGLKGEKFSLYMPVTHQGKTLEYLFEFAISDIAPIDPKTQKSKSGIWKEH